MELAPLRKIGRVRHQALDGLETLGVLVQRGDRVEQPLGIGVGGVVKDVLQGAILHNFSRIHNGYLVAGLGHDAQIVGNEDHGGVELPL